MGALSTPRDLALFLAFAASAPCCSAAEPGIPAPPGEAAGPLDAPLRSAPMPVAPDSPVPDAPDFGAISPAPPPAGGAAAPSHVIWAVDAQDHLLRFTTGAPGAVTSQPITGLAAGDHVVGIATRRSDGATYVLGGASRLYALDRKTAKALPLMAVPFTPSLAGASFGFTFDDADRARVVSDATQNIGLDTATGWVANFDVPLAFRDEDTNAADVPGLVAMASARGALYAIDAGLDLLTRVSRIADGQVETIGTLGADATAATGFDVASDGSAWATMTSSGKPALYQIDLDTGAAKEIARVGATVPLRGIAIER